MADWTNARVQSLQFFLPTVVLPNLLPSCRARATRKPVVCYMQATRCLGIHAEESLSIFSSSTSASARLVCIKHLQWLVDKFIDKIGLGLKKVNTERIYIDGIKLVGRMKSWQSNLGYIRLEMINLIWVRSLERSKATRSRIGIDFMQFAHWNRMALASLSTNSACCPSLWFLQYKVLITAPLWMALWSNMAFL